MQCNTGSSLLALALPVCLSPGYRLLVSTIQQLKCNAGSKANRTVLLLKAVRVLPSILLQPKIRPVQKSSFPPVGYSSEKAYSAIYYAYPI